jgi:DNA-binding transcriptional MerR regulator
MKVAPDSVTSITQIAEQCDCKRHQVEYILNKLGIKPKGKVGQCRLFTQADLEAVRAELKARSRRKGGGRG